MESGHCYSPPPVDAINASKDLAFLNELQREWDFKSSEADFPKNPKSVIELAQILKSCTSLEGTHYWCHPCQQIYKMPRWAAKHLVNKHLDPSVERAIFCRSCNVKLHCKKTESVEEMLERHHGSAAHKASVNFPTMSGHNQPVIFCPNEGCGQTFSDSTTGRKHKARCDKWTVEKRNGLKKVYLTPDELKRRVEAQFKPMPWDTATPRPLTAEEVNEDNRQLQELWEGLMSNVNPNQMVVQEATPEENQEIVGMLESVKENIPPPQPTQPPQPECPPSSPTQNPKRRHKSSNPRKIKKAKVHF